MNKKIFKNIVLMEELAIIISLAFFITYFMFHKLKEKSVLEKFKAEITELRREGNYYFRGDYKFDARKNIEHCQKIEKYSQNGKLTIKSSYWIVDNGKKTITQDNEEYHIGGEATVIDNLDKIYWKRKSRESDYTKSIKDFEYISKLLSSPDNVDLKYEKEDVFNGKKCYVATVQYSNTYEWIYIDKKSFLPIGIKNKEGWLCEIEFKINPQIPDSEFEIQDLSSLTRRETDEKTGKYIYIKPDGIITENIEEILEY